MNARFFRNALSLLFVVLLYSHSRGEEILLWPSEETEPRAAEPGEEPASLERIVVREAPSITVLLPPEEARTGAGVVICAGGGYSILAFEKEALEIGRWMNERGIAAFCLKYRCGGEPNTHPIPHNDGLRAMRLVRSRAEEWGVSSEKIGIMGFSAGGHLAASVSTLSDDGNPEADDPLERLSSRPDFSLLIYPVISMQEITHKGSFRQLLGDDPPKELVDRLSCELQVNDKTPPAFLVHATDDEAVKVSNSLRYYEALVAHKVPAELHVFDEGGHGFGMRPTGKPVDAWPNLAEAWLKSRGLAR